MLWAIEELAAGGRLEQQRIQINGIGYWSRDTRMLMKETALVAGCETEGRMILGGWSCDEW